jgi:3-oxoacyl-[acyl-carrier protein] reductase
LKKLENKRAIVTGGTRGIGKAIVLELASQGCDVVFTYNSSSEAAANIEAMSADLGVKLFGIQADAARFSEAEKTINFSLEKLGGLDILVNNAGITRDNLILRMKEEDFDQVIAANLKSVFNYSKLSVKPMMSQKYGKIINISSIVALIGNAGQANYVASKAGVIGLTKSLAREFASRNITVNAIAPGYVATDMTEKLNDKQKEALINQIPLGKIALPEDIAKTVAFLSSSDADYITGQTLVVDGGLTM